MMRAQTDHLSMEAERAELESVVEALGRSSRLANLLHFVGEKYFSGEGDQLSEYTIATEVFGRSKTAFDPGEDAIARVEAHRLRKKLKEYYEGPGRNRQIHLSIPSGTYVPSFTRSASDPQQPAVSATGEAPEARAAKVIATDTPSEKPASRLTAASPEKPRIPGWMLVLATVVVACAVVTAVYLQRRSNPGTGAANVTANADLRGSGNAPALGSAQAPVRILAGYTGAPQTDSTGAVWQADQDFRGGGGWHRTETTLARTSEPFLFQYWRTGDSFYDIPLKPGVYEVHLYFVTSERSNEDLSTFTVRINGDPVLRGFDINSDALGENIADERIFRDVSPASDGKLHLSFTSERGAPQINAIEVLPGIPHKQLPIRLLMQRTSFTDHENHFWRPDDYFMNGRLSDQRQDIPGSPDPDLFSSERYGHFTYVIPVDTRDRYTLILHFVEFYFGQQTADGGAGSRVFRVLCNGQTLLDNFDIYKEAGSLHVLTKTFYHLKPSPQGKLNLTFEPIANNATVSGIEILDESQ